MNRMRVRNVMAAVAAGVLAGAAAGGEAAADHPARPARVRLDLQFVRVRPAALERLAKAVEEGALGGRLLPSGATVGKGGQAVAEGRAREAARLRAVAAREGGLTPGARDLALSPALPRDAAAVSAWVDAAVRAGEAEVAARVPLGVVNGGVAAYAHGVDVARPPLPPAWPDPDERPAPPPPPGPEPVDDAADDGVDAEGVAEPPPPPPNAAAGDGEEGHEEGDEEDGVPAAAFLPEGVGEFEGFRATFRPTLTANRENVALDYRLTFGFVRAFHPLMAPAEPANATEVPALFPITETMDVRDVIVLRDGRTVMFGLMPDFFALPDDARATGLFLLVTATALPPDPRHVKAWPVLPPPPEPADVF